MLTDQFEKTGLFLFLQSLIIDLHLAPFFETFPTVKFHFIPDLYTFHGVIYYNYE